MSEKLVGTKKALFIVLIVAYTIVLILVGKAWVERYTVKKAAEANMQLIQQGLDDETINKVVDNIISKAAGDGLIGSYLQNKVNGDDINDIYHVIMRRLTYKVTAVEKMQSGSYRVGLVIQNNDNIKIVQEAAILYAERYDGNFFDKACQLWADINSDKSQLIASLISEAAEILETNQGSQLLFSEYYVISADSNGDFIFENDNGLLSFILACAGIDYAAGESPEIEDEYKLYSVLLVILVLSGVLAVVYYFQKKAKTQADTSTLDEGCTPEFDNLSNLSGPSNCEATHQPVISKAGTPILYAQSIQHNNTPFAVHDTPILIGRDKASCKVVFNEGTAGVSGRHCSISYDSSIGQFVLVDLRSTYGTYLMSGEKLTANKQYYLKAGDSFFVGDKSNVFKVEIG